MLMLRMLQIKMSSKQIVCKVMQTIKKYNLLNKNDKILVACSGGKDSTTVLYILHKLGYKVEALHINLLMGEWSKRNEQNLKDFCRQNKINLHIYSIRNLLGKSMCYIKSAVKSKSKLQDCTICGILRRWLINRLARKLKADKLATGHNLDDASQTILMNLFKGNLMLGLGEGPMAGITGNKKFVQRVKPLYFCLEKDIENYSKEKNLPVLYERCPCVINAYRHKIRKALDKLEKKNPDVKIKIVNSFFKILPLLRKSQINNKSTYCKSCGEASRNETCKACSIMENLKND